MTGTRVLVVDDELETAQLWVRMLAREGLRARAVGSAPEALDIARHFAPDVAVLDIHLGGDDGQALGLELRRRLPRLRLIDLTGDGRFALDERSERLGFHAHLVKPVRPKDLLRMIDLTLLAYPPGGPLRG